MACSRVLRGLHAGYAPLEWAGQLGRFPTGDEARSSAFRGQPQHCPRETTQDWHETWPGWGMGAQDLSASQAGHLPPLAARQARLHGDSTTPFRLTRRMTRERHGTPVHIPQASRQCRCVLEGRTDSCLPVVSPTTARHTPRRAGLSYQPAGVCGLHPTARGPSHIGGLILSLNAGRYGCPPSFRGSCARLIR